MFLVFGWRVLLQTALELFSMVIRPPPSPPPRPPPPHRPPPISLLQVGGELLLLAGAPIIARLRGVAADAGRLPSQLFAARVAARAAQCGDTLLTALELDFTVHCIPRACHPPAHATHPSVSFPACSDLSPYLSLACRWCSRPSMQLRHSKPVPLPQSQQQPQRTAKASKAVAGEGCRGVVLAWAP